jgi:hypothetical protein
MDDDGPKGAEAAAVYFLELDPYIQSTGDTQDWDSMSHPKCKFCANRSEQARQIADGGYRFNGGEVRATVSHTYAQDTATGIWPIDIDVTIAPTTITDSSGTDTFSEVALSSRERVEMLWQSDGWSVIGVGVIEAGGK